MKHFQSVSKITWKHLPKIIENPCLDLYFDVLLCLGATPGTPRRPYWDRDPKNHQTITCLNPLFGAYLWQVLYVFGDVFFAMFSEPHFCQLSGLRGIHLHQLEAHLGSKVITIGTNLQKCKLHSRSRGDTKIKLFRVSASRWCINFWYVLSKPVIATLHRRHYSHYA